MTPTRIAAIAAATIIGLTGLSACGSSGGSSSSSKSSSASKTSTPSSSPAPSSSSGGSSSSKMAMITIKDFKYSGAKTVAAGSKVMIMNNDAEAHTVTADSGSAFDVTVAPGKTATLTAPSKPGSYAYHCTFHSGMHGMLKVG
jgi:plastocyanin